MEYIAKISWTRGSQIFVDQHYDRSHTWEFDGGLKIDASSSPHVVPVPYSNAAAIDPEEAFIASISSCHMLWFLSIAAKEMFCVDSYTDQASGVMNKDEFGKLSITQVTLRPKIIFSLQEVPSQHAIILMHEEAHRNCFIANSVKTEIIFKPIF